MLKRGLVMFVVGSVGGFAIATASCGTKTNPPGDGGTTGGTGTGTCQVAGGTSCQTVGDCPNGTNFKCDSTSNCCEFFCLTKTDCGGPSDPKDACTSSSLGCVCDQGVCKSKQCSADADCGATGLVCKGGTCTQPDPASSAFTVLVQPNPAVLHVGAAQQFTATVLDSSGKAVILGAGGVSWAVTGSGSTIDQTGKLSPTTESTNFGDNTITATVGTVNGTAVGTVYAAPKNGVQVTLIDGAANVPIVDATVEYSDATGAVAGTAVMSGDTLGRYALKAPPAGAVLLSVFEPNYQYISVDVTALPASNDVVLLLAQNTVSATVGGSPQPVVGGYTGDFQTQPGILDPGHGEPVSETGDIHIGIAGTAIPQDLLDISLSALLGPSHDVTINIGGSHVVPLPQGIELGFGTTYFKCAYDGLGAAGGCPVCSNGSTTDCINPTDTETDPTKADWANSIFACGQRSAWGLGGGVPFSAISGQLGALAGGNVSIATILTAVLPDFSGFNSGVFFQVPYTLQPPVVANTVDDACSGMAFTDATAIPNPAVLTPATKVPLSLDTGLALLTSVTLPPLPSVGTGATAACQTTALVLGGAIEPGYGLLPLGLSAGTILDSSNNPSSTCKTYDTDPPGTAANGHVTMNVAPEHGGVERDTYGVVALSLDVSALGGGSGVTAISGLVTTMPALPYNTAVAFSGNFPAYLQLANYNPNGRVFTNDSTNNSGATWERLRFQDDLQREWITYFSPGTGTFVLPTPPTSCGTAGTCNDRTLTSGGKLASPEAQQVITNASTTFSGFLDFTNGPAAANLITSMTGFSAVGIQCPAGVMGGGC